MEGKVLRKSLQHFSNAKMIGHFEVFQLLIQSKLLSDLLCVTKSKFIIQKFCKAEFIADYFYIY